MRVVLLEGRKKPEIIANDFHQIEDQSSPDAI
jgi:hypothetical protein